MKVSGKQTLEILEATIGRNLLLLKMRGESKKTGVIQEFFWVLNVLDEIHGFDTTAREE